MKTPSDDAFVFNIVWTGKVFTYLRYFVASQIAHSGARFRFVVNGCPPEQIELMERFATSQPDRVTDVLVVRDEMGAHGVALDAALDRRDDGEFFCFIDPDILARGPFVADFAAACTTGPSASPRAAGCGVTTTSARRGRWGSRASTSTPRMASCSAAHTSRCTAAARSTSTLARWEVGFGSAGPDLSDAAKQHLQDINRRYMLYDTGKLVNIFLQEDGQLLRHFEHPNLMHIGGMSHYLSPPDGGGGADEAGWKPDQTTWPWPVGRLEVALYTAAVLRSLCDGQPAPGVPTDVDPALAPPARDGAQTSSSRWWARYQDSVDRA